MALRWAAAADGRTAAAQLPAWVTATHVGSLEGGEWVVIAAGAGVVDSRPCSEAAAAQVSKTTKTRERNHLLYIST